MENLQLIHPAVIHFPIVFILLTLTLELLWLVLKKEGLKQLAEYSLVLSVFFSIVGVVTGYIASSTLGHNAPGHDFVHQHRDIMLWMVALLVLSLIWLLISRGKKLLSLRKTLIIPLLITTGILIYGADRGASLVYKHGIGTLPVLENMEENLDHLENTQEGSHENNEHTH